MTDPRDVMRSRSVRGVVQVAIILALAAVAWRVAGLDQEQEQSAQTVTAVSGILARTCGAASFADLRRQGLVEECRLAVEGELPDAIPDDQLPETDAEPEDVEADVVEDDGTSTPADVQPTQVADAQVVEAVDAYFASNPLNAQPGYQRAVERSTAAYLSANPPERGRPPTGEEVREAVRTVLLANPPAPGSDGRSVTSATLDGCDVVFTYSDGTASRVGPVCGADGQTGPPPSDQQIAQAVVAYCSSNGSCRGPVGPPGVVQTADNCQPASGEFVTDVAISGPVGDPATITISCTTQSVVPGLGNDGGGP